MDEEDGRLGPPPGHIIGNLLIDVTGGRTQQLGRIDVLTDASTNSLRQPDHSFPLGAPGLDSETWEGYPSSKDLLNKTNQQRGKS